MWALLTFEKMLKIVIFACLARENFAANILGIFPYTAKSHFTMYEPLLRELHARGHNLTVMSHFPLAQAQENYTDVSLIGSTPSLHGNLSMSLLDDAPYSLGQNLRQIHQDASIFESMLQSRAVQEFLKSESTFDVLIVEMFDTDVFLGLVHRFHAPYISISPCPLLPWTHGRTGHSSNPAYVPTFFSSFSNDMDGISRALNAIYHLVANVYYHKMAAESQKVAEKYFPEVSLKEIAKNVSLVLVNTHSSLHRPPPTSPKIIEVGGMHVRPPQPLKDETLRSFLETAEHGVILFSMGSMFKLESLPEQKKDAFERALKKVQQRVIWKWESTAGKSVNGNVLYMDWVPQREVLAHRNVVLFIYHGGLLGVTEAVYCGVPILGIPVFGDMGVNMAAVTSAGAGLSLPFRDITDDLLYNTIQHMIYEPRYRQKAAELAHLFRDRPMDPLKTAVYWTEYVIRNRGAPNLISHNLSWYQLWFLDIIIPFCLTLAAVVLATALIAKRLISSMLRTLKAKKL